MRYKTLVLVVFAVFAVSLAVVVGKRLSSEAMAVIVGVVAGVAASIPTSLVVVWVALRTRPGETRVVEEHRPQSSAPKTIVVAPHSFAQPFPASAGAYPYPPANAALPPPSALPYDAEPRSFTVIGGEEEDPLLEITATPQ